MKIKKHIENLMWCLEWFGEYLAYVAGIFFILFIPVALLKAMVLSDMLPGAWREIGLMFVPMIFAPLGVCILVVVVPQVWTRAQTKLNEWSKS